MDSAAQCTHDRVFMAVFLDEGNFFPHFRVFCCQLPHVLQDIFQLALANGHHGRFAVGTVEDGHRFLMLHDRLAMAQVVYLFAAICFQRLGCNNLLGRPPRNVIPMRLLAGKASLCDLERLSKLLASVFLERLLMRQEIGVLGVPGEIGRQIVIDLEIHGKSVRLISPVDGLAPTLLVQVGAILESSLEVYHQNYMQYQFITTFHDSFHPTIQLNKIHKQVFPLSSMMEVRVNLPSSQNKYLLQYHYHDYYHHDYYYHFLDYPRMDIQRQNQHYLLTSEYPHSERTIVQAFHLFEGARHFRMIAIANHNQLQIYRNIGGSMVYDRSHQFMCDISVLLVLPLKGETCDILFLADDNGRYIFWSPINGALLVSNKIRTADIKLPFYESDNQEVKQPLSSDIHFTFNSLNTEATLFFNLGSQKILVIRVQANSKSLLYLHPPTEFDIPYLDISYIGMIKSRKPSIGFIQQQEQKRMLKIHSLASENFDLISSMQKSNITRFHCSNGEDLITVSHSQISITSLKSNNMLCNFEIAETGYICDLDVDKYLFVGELGSQMIVFGRNRFKNYGSFMLENDRCVVLCGLGRLNDGGYMIGVIDQGFTVEVMALYEDYWKSIKTIMSVASIFSVQEMDPLPFRDPKQNQCLAVIKVSDNIHQVGIISKKIPSRLLKQTAISSPILQAFSFNKGLALILCTPQSNTILTYNSSSQNFETSFEFPSEHILLAVDRYLVTTEQIYEIDLSKNRIVSLYSEKERIVAADYDGSKYIGFQCENFCYKFFNVGSKEIDWIRKNLCEDYIWKFFRGDTLLIGSMDCLEQLKIVPAFSAPKPPLHLAISELISDMTNIGETDMLVVSFINAIINIYLVSTDELLYTMAASSQAMKLVKCINTGGILAYSPSSVHYIVMNNSEGFLIKQMDFDRSKDIIDCIYLQKQDKILFTHEDAVAMYELPSKQNTEKDHSSSFRILSVSISSENGSNQPPLVTTLDTYLYIASSYELNKRDLLTSELLKKQSHTLKEVTSIENLKSGLLLCGIDDMQHAQMILFDYQDLQILASLSLSKQQLLSTSIKSHENQYWIRVEQYLMLYEYIPATMSFKEKLCWKIGLYGYTLAINTENNMILVSDPLRYVAVYIYEFNKIVPVCRFNNLNTINDVEFIGEGVVMGDTVGNLAIYEMNMGDNDVARSRMSEVGSIGLGSELLYAKKGKQSGKNSVLFCTLSGYIGRISTIASETFEILKKGEERGLQLLSNHKQLDYQGWRKRPNLQDKIIDSYLIQILLQKQKSTTLATQVHKIWKF